MGIDEVPEGFLGLSTALEGLRQELEAAWSTAKGQRVRFRVSDVSLTVQAVASKERRPAARCGGGWSRRAARAPGASKRRRR